MNALCIYLPEGITIMQTYTFGQCARLLDIDPKVFRRWVREDLGLLEHEQVSRADSRVRYLTREQLERLAELHERTLPADGEQGKQERAIFGSTKLLEDRLGAAEDTLRTCEQTVSSAQEELTHALKRLTQVEQQVDTMAQWATPLEGLPEWMKQIEIRLEQTHEQPDPRLTELEVQRRQQIADLEARYQRQIDELEAQLARYRAGKRPHATTPVMTTKKATSRAKPLPKTLASRSGFAALHHVPDSVVARACNSDKIAAINGRWLYKSRIIFQALGERGRRDFYLAFHTRPDFTLCKQCPHEIKEE